MTLQHMNMVMGDDGWRTFSISPFRVRDLSFTYTGPTISWPQMIRMNRGVDPGPPYHKDVFEYFDPSDGSSDDVADVPLMYTIYSDVSSPAPAQYSVRQVAQIQGSCDYFPRVPFDKWETVAAPSSYGHTAGSVGTTKIMEGIFQFAYDTDLTTIVAQFRVTLTYTRTAP